jgi:hypothetical protein
MWKDLWTFEKGYPMGYRPFVPLFVRGRLNTAASKDKTMYWTLQEWSMSNSRKFPRFILIRHPK